MKSLTFLFFISSILYSCKNDSSEKNNKTDAAGTYIAPNTGAILFEIKKDSIGYYTLMANNGRPSKRDSFRLEEFSKLESEWTGFCGKDYSKWMGEHVVGGDDWRVNFNTGLFDTYNKFYFLSLKKGYASKEHLYSTGYCLIFGSECFVTNIIRLNIDKIDPVKR